MPRTMILEPLSESDLDENVADMLKEALGRIRSLLNSMNADETMNFVEFLEKLDLTKQQYIKAIRLSLKHSTLLLKRSPSEIRINCYNPHLLKAWRANMDIQFVLDPYACAVYILSYITKGQRGMSKLLRKACEEAKEGNKNIVNKVRHIGKKFLNAVEISAQEAVYLVLQMPLRRSSREFQFINTSDPDERTFLLKSMDKIKELPDNSIDIESDNIIKRYQRRPKQMENVCLADFVAWYNCKSESNEQRHLKTSSPCADNYLPESIIDDNLDDDVCDLEQTSENDKYEMKGGITLVKRQKPRIIRSVRFNKNKDPENYYREQIMLYTAWRNESRDLLKDFQTYQDRFEIAQDEIKQNRKQYANHSDILDQAVQDIESEESGNIVAPNAQYRDEQDREIGSKLSELFGCFDPGRDKQHAEYDLINDIGIYPRTNDDEELVVKGLKDADFRKLVQSLNVEQKEFFYHVLNSVKTDRFQLKPVCDQWIFENSKDGYTALATNLWQQYFQMFELSEVMRQREDKDFAEILNRIREGKHTEADIAVLKKRILNLSPQHPDYPINSTHLFSTNMAVDQHNHDIFLKGG